MTTTDHIATFPAELAWWRQNLARYSDAQLAEGESEDDWSIGQLYAHLGQSALFFHLRLAQEALDAAPGGPVDNPVAAQMMTHGFGGQRIKVPASPQYTPRQPESRAAIEATFDQVSALYEQVAERAKAIGGGTSAHPRLGAFTAEQWLALIPIHFQHHRAQLERREERL